MRHIEIIEYAAFEGQYYLKEYRTTSYLKNKVVDINHYWIDEIRLTDEDDHNLRFKVPPEVRIEQRSLN